MLDNPRIRRVQRPHDFSLHTLDEARKHVLHHRHRVRNATDVLITDNLGNEVARARNGRNGHTDPNVQTRILVLFVHNAIRDALDGAIG